MRQRERTDELSFTLDTVRTARRPLADTVAVRSVAPFGTVVPTLEPRTLRRTETYGYFGVGFVYRNRQANGTAGVTLKPVIGMRDDRKVFYQVRFNVEEGKSGVRLGGEINGLFRPDLPVPVFSVYLAETFSLAKLGEFLGS